MKITVTLTIDCDPYRLAASPEISDAECTIKDLAAFLGYYLRHPLEDPLRGIHNVDLHVVRDGAVEIDHEQMNLWECETTGPAH
jgi:hypothetical protein